MSLRDFGMREFFCPRVRANPLFCLRLRALLLPQCFQRAGSKNNQKTERR